MMKEEFSLVLDEQDVKLALSRKKVLLDGKELDVRTVSLGKKRKYSAFQMILYMLAVIAAGVIFYAALNAVFAGNNEGSPYMEIDNLNEVGIMQRTQLYDLYSGEKPAMFKNALVIPPYRFYWLQAR